MVGVSKIVKISMNIDFNILVNYFHVRPIDTLVHLSLKRCATLCNQCNSMQYYATNVILYNTMQHYAPICNTAQHRMTPCNIMP